MNYPETLHYLYTSLPVFQHVGGSAYKAGLDNILALEAELGDPHRRIRSIHIAGTNGKGSLSSMIASVLAQGGLRVGLFTSPHLHDFRERIRICGEMISEQEVVDFVATHREAIERIKPSFFEITTAMAFDHFAKKEVDIAVIEVGMGGRLDSTNIIRPLLTVITNISYDHSQFLGDSLEKIAIEKAGIIKSDTPVVIGQSQIESQLAFISCAKAEHAQIRFADQHYRIEQQQIEQVEAEHTKEVESLHPLPSTPCNTQRTSLARKPLQRFVVESLLDGARFELSTDLLGSYQRYNIVTLLSALDVLNTVGVPITAEQVRLGVARVGQNTHLWGRWQLLGNEPLTLCDTAHNEAGIREVVTQLTALPHRKLYLVLGFVADKALDHVLPLLPKEAYYLFTQAPTERALPAEELQRQAKTYGLQGECIKEVSQAYERARGLATAKDVIFVGGSNFVVAELQREQ